MIFVDGGMTDNIRPSLYGAKYSAIITNKLDCEKNQTYRVGGKLCESGDILIEKVKLSKADRDDLLLVPYAGAYTFSMSSNYNKLPQPAVVFVEDGKDYCAVKRQFLEDLIQRNLKYRKWEKSLFTNKFKEGFLLNKNISSNILVIIKKWILLKK